MQNAEGEIKAARFFHSAFRNQKNMNRTRLKNQAGFSMMELLVVMVVMLIIMTATFSLLHGSMTTANTNYEMTTAGQGLRNSQEFLNRDILSAGDGLKGISNIWLPIDFVTGYLSARPVSELDPTNSGYVSIGAILSDNQVPAGTIVKDSIPATSVLPNTDRLTVLAVDPTFTSIDVPVGASNRTTGEINIPASRLADFTVGEVLYITSGGTGAFGTITNIDTGANRIVWAEGDAFGLNRLGDTGPLGVATNYGSSPASLRRINIIHYFADAEGRLVRRTFGVRQNGFVDSVIAEHLTDLQLRYILKPTGSGTIFERPTDQITLADSVRVRMIEPRLIVQTAYPLQNGEYESVEGITQIGVRNVQFLEAPVPVDTQGNTTLPNPGPTPVRTPEPTPTPTPPPPTPTPTPPPPTPTPTPTPVPTPGTPTPTPTATPTPPPTPTPVPTPTRTPTPRPTPTPGNGDG